MRYLLIWQDQHFVKESWFTYMWEDNKRLSLPISEISCAGFFIVVIVYFSLSLNWLTSDQQCKDSRGGPLTISLLSEVIWFLKYLEHQPNINPGNVYIFPVGCVFWVSEYHSLSKKA